MRELTVPMHPWSEEGTALLKSLEVEREQGLSTSQAQTRILQFGNNELDPPKPISKLKILLAQFRGVLFLLLLAACAIAFAVGDWVEALAILSVLLINALLGFVTELKAARSMEALRKLGHSQTAVRRNGTLQVIDSTLLVPGDIVQVEAGDRVSADLRILDVAQLSSDESPLTGESLPVAKGIDAVSETAFVGDRSCMLFSGTTITTGAGTGVVSATGHQAEIGKIAALVEEAGRSGATPLEKRLDRLARTLVWVTLLVAALVAIVGISSGKPTLLIIETSIALAIAAVPEGLPVLATMILARGVHRMANRNALVQRLSAVETLGSTGLICTDKTGTLTENEMSVDEIADCEGVSAPGEPHYEEALKLASWCNNAALGQEGESDTGDPLEVALLKAARAAGMTQKAQIARELAFDSEIRMMATYHQEESGYLVAVKGAPEEVLAATREGTTREAWLSRAETMAGKGLRVIAVARRECTDLQDEAYRDLEIVALIGLLDPPRPDVRQSILDCRRAGIDVCMMTGDHPQTAQYIAQRVGIIDDDAESVLTGVELAKLDPALESDAETIAKTRVFARVSPEQKLSLVAFHQARGRVVAMTGDGVNDAPALRKADIGVAMGLRGTEVAREAAEVVLLDDSFPSIVEAVREGRGVFVNIRSFIVYLLSCNLSEILVVGLATAVQAPLPLLPLQILFLNLVTDVFPALALGANETSPSAMSEPPRKPGQKILGNAEWKRIVGYGLVMTVSVLTAFFVALAELGLSTEESISVAFLTLALAQLWHVFNMGSAANRWLDRQVVRNLFVWGAVAFCVLLLAIAMYWQPAASLLSLKPLGQEPLILVGTASVVPLLVGAMARKVGTLLRRTQAPVPEHAP